MLPMLKAWYKDIFKKNGKLDDLLNTDITNTLFDYYNKGLKKNYVAKYATDKKVIEALQKNINIFNIFKNHKHQSDIASLLTKKGKVVSYDEFEKEALKISLNYNRNWLKTEFNTVVEQAKLVSYWQKIDREKEKFPYLQYITRDDDKVRNEHQQWHGIVLPVTHSFWNTHYPTNGFNCRCTVRQLTENQAMKIGITKKPNIETYSKEFNFNAGKEQIIFGEYHSYFQDIPEETKKLLFELGEVTSREKKRW